MGLFKKFAKLTKDVVMLPVDVASDLTGVSLLRSVGKDDLHPFESVKRVGKIADDVSGLSDAVEEWLDDD